MNRSIYLLLICLMLTNAPVFGQVAVSYYPFQSVLSVSTDTEKMCWADLRAETNTFFSNINLECNAMVNIKRTDWVNYYVGAGINMNPFYGKEDLPFVNGYTLNTGVRVKPIQKHKNLQVILELSPYANRYFDGGLLRTMLGIAYNFPGGRDRNKRSIPDASD